MLLFLIKLYFRVVYLKENCILDLIYFSLFFKCLLISFLKKAKFVIQSKPLQESPDGKKRQKGIDLFMYKEIVELMEAYEKVIIISGDSDFIDAVKEIKKFNKMVDVWSFKKSLSYKWRNAVGLEYLR